MGLVIHHMPACLHSYAPNTLHLCASMCMQIPLDKYRARDQLAANSTSATTSAAVTRFGSSTVPGLFNLSQPPVLLPFTGEGQDKATCSCITLCCLHPFQPKHSQGVNSRHGASEHT